MSDPLAPLLDLPDVPDAVRAARDAVDAVHNHPVNRRGWPTTAAEATVRAARASAAIDGADVELPEGGEVDEPVLAGALRVGEALGSLLPTWQRAPLQVLARMHVLAASDLQPDPEQLGRPRRSGDAPERIEMLAQLLSGSTSVPGPVLAAVVHGELLSLEPFGTADGVVARAAGRLTMIATGLDPKGLCVPEVAFLRRMRRYREAAQGFAGGEPEGVGTWLLLCCEAFEAGAKEGLSIADAAAEE
ncbi:oxidoreductase [Haloechinothrix sp. YIM 98757]|uniref:Oxidoreductase n=1 Tax=Haloechinothrix aidingensis TaxID=2752311 RepID=A0A838ADM1_9PSEU|nr:oxidoreductase [Haloechinothrix aidingensis]